MLQGLAIWHYSHRSMVDNIRYFAALGLDSVSVHGAQFVGAIADPAASERGQIAHLKGNPRFGYLVDIGHLFIRVRGENHSGKTLFTNFPDEHPVCKAPDCAVFKTALESKDFPIFEMHLHNNDGADDVHWFLEQREMDVPAVGHALREIGFDGVLTVESAPASALSAAGRTRTRGYRGRWIIGRPVVNHEKKPRNGCVPRSFDVQIGG